MRIARLAAPALGLLLLFALLAREGPRRTGADADVPAIERVLDAESAWNLRRVEVALAAGRVAQFDRAAAFPEGADVVDPPVFVAALTGLATLVLGDRAGGSGGAPLDEVALAEWLQHVGPLLGVLLVFLVYRAAVRLGGRDARRRGLLAAAQVAVGAPFIAACALGKLPLGAWTALLAGVGLAWATPLFRRGGDPVDRLQAALLAGLVTGVALAGSPIALVTAVPIVLLSALAVWRTADLEARRVRARELLLFSAPAACLAALPALGGPWQSPAEGSPVARLSHDLPLVLLAASAPALLSFWPGVSRRIAGTHLPAMLTVLALVGVGLLATRLATDLPEPAGIPWPSAWLVLHGVGLACVVHDRARRGATARTESDEVEEAEEAEEADADAGLAAWCAALPLALLAALFDERAVLLAGVAGAVVLAAAAWPARGATRRWVLAATAVVLVADLAQTFLARGAAGERRRSEVAVVRALRELRETTPSAGPWNASRAPLSWCIAAPAALAPAVLLHARRPVDSVGDRVVRRGGVLGPRAVWAARDAAELERRARSSGVGALCLRPGDLDRLPAPARGEGRAFWSDLIREGSEGPERRFAGPRDGLGRAALTILRFVPTSAQSQGASGR